MPRSLILAAAAALALAGCATTGTDGQGAMADAGDMTPETRDAFVPMAASSDLFEIQSSQLALSRSQSQPIRQFAQMMVTDHTRMSQQLMAAAQAAGMPPMTP